MCACEPGWTCPRCAGTRFDLAYFDAQSDPDRNDPAEQDDKSPAEYEVRDA